MAVPCESCSRLLEPAEKSVTCGRPRCGKMFHPFCADLNLTLWNALEAGIGLEWFCPGCRTNRLMPAAEPVGMGDLLARIEQLEDKVVTGFARCLEKMEAMEDRFPKQLKADTGSVPRCQEQPIGILKQAGTSRAPKDVLSVESELLHPSVDFESMLKENMTVRPVVVAKEPSEMFSDLVWIAIFRNLNGHQMCQARLTCRHWNRIIGGSTLMEKLEIRFPKRSILDKNCDEVRNLGASNSRYKRVVLEEVTIIKATLWWSSIGDHIHTIALKNCVMAVEDLLEILKNTLNLKCLYFDTKLTDEHPDHVFQVQALEELALGKAVQPETVRMFRKLCPRLKELTVDHEDFSNDILTATRDLVSSTENTLENVSLLGTNAQSVINLEDGNFRLKKVHIEPMNASCLKRFCRLQPTIEEIKAEIHEEVPLDHFPKDLKRLELSVISHGIWLSQSLLQVKQLMLRNRRNITNLFLTESYDNLERMEFSLFYISPLILRHFPNLRILKLENCSIETWKALLMDCSQLKHLYHLELSNIDSRRLDDSFLQYMENITVLKLSGCQLSGHFMNTIFTLSPNLEIVHLAGMRTVDDIVLRTVCQKLKRLKSLTLIALESITDDSVHHIIRHCAAIETVKLLDNYGISVDALQRLKVHRNLQLICDMIE